MKNTSLSILLFLISFTVFSQDISGQWNGILSVQGRQLRLVMNIAKNNQEGYTATLDSPDQGAKGIPVTAVDFTSRVLKVTIASLNFEYTGMLDAGNVFRGALKQNGVTFPMDLGREVIEKAKVKRPQEPVKPYPYYSEDIKFDNKKDRISLAGTLTLPAKEGNFPVVILISGSGNQNRDEEIWDHKPFLVLSDHLTRNGIAVLRFDDRGTAESTGDFSQATTRDFATDVASAVTYLKTRKEINTKKIGLIGHSEGGLIAPMIATESEDVAFIVLLAGPGVRGDQVLLQQFNRIGTANGGSAADIEKNRLFYTKNYAILNAGKDTSEIRKQLTIAYEEAFANLPLAQQPPVDKRSEFIRKEIEPMLSPWFRFYIAYDPAIALAKVKCPVLALNGEKDWQVSSKEDLEGIRKALAKAGNKNVTIKELPRLNHLFQESDTGSPEEYATIEQTFAPSALREISDWIKKIVNP